MPTSPSISVVTPTGDRFARRCQGSCKTPKRTRSVVCQQRENGRNSQVMCSAGSMSQRYHRSDKDVFIKHAPAQFFNFLRFGVGCTNFQLHWVVVTQTNDTMTSRACVYAGVNGWVQLAKFDTPDKISKSWTRISSSTRFLLPELVTDTHFFPNNIDAAIIRAIAQDFFKSLSNRRWDKIPIIPRKTQQTNFMFLP